MKTEEEKMLAGEQYNPEVPELIEYRDNTQNLLQKFNSNHDFSVLKELFPQKDESARIMPPFFCDYGHTIKFSKNVFVNYNCTFLSCAPIVVGENTFIGPNVQLYTAVHPTNPELRITGVETSKPITIGKNCWLGGGVIVLPGVEIGEGCTIGAGSVVTKSIPPRSVAVGNPCKVIKKV
ncbi:MAG: sugar O-acetyltransferase [Clostridiaceae bacterium]|jgi:maltose O-acetyltransferase|nr:sugar O-acetyltransferase [Clostridiaceae bacterium]